MESRNGEAHSLSVKDQGAPAPILGPDTGTQTGAVACLADLTERKQAEVERNRLFAEVEAARSRMQSLSKQLVAVQEAERRRIARELHDEIGQGLTALRLNLEMSARLSGDAARASLEEAKLRVDELLGRVRELSLNLRPGLLDDLGLLPALHWHFDRYFAQTRVVVTFMHSGLDGRRFCSEVETAAYRFIQEALTNVARHAGVQEATVRVWVQGDTLAVQVEDRGTGFDAEAALQAGTTAGLSGMRERVDLLGGRFCLESMPGKGTRLTAELPLTDSEG